MISFPASPSSGQQYSEGGTTWEYNGTVWNVIAETTGEQTVDNIQVGVTTNNTIDTSTGDLVLGAIGNVVLAADLITTGYKINSSYELPGADGTAGQVLRTDGSGIVSFQSPTQTFGNITIGVSDDQTIDTTSGTLILDSQSGNITAQGNINIIGSISPIINAVYNLGASTNTWGNIYSSATTTNSITTLAGNLTVNSVGGTVTVMGNVNFNGNYTFPAADGTIGQVLTTDGSGTVSFVTPPQTLADFNIMEGTAGQLLHTDGAGMHTWSSSSAAGFTFGNLQIGIIDSNTIDTTSGNLELDSATGMTYVVDDLYVTGSIDFLGTLTQNGNMVDTGNPDPRIVREESGTDVTYTFN